MRPSTLYARLSGKSKRRRKGGREKRRIEEEDGETSVRLRGMAKRCS